MHAIMILTSIITIIIPVIIMTTVTIIIPVIIMTTVTITRTVSLPASLKSKLSEKSFFLLVKEMKSVYQSGGKLASIEAVSGW